MIPASPEFLARIAYWWTAVMGVSAAVTLYLEIKPSGMILAVSTVISAFCAVTLSHIVRKRRRLDLPPADSSRDS